MHQFTSYLKAVWIFKVIDSKVSGFSSENMTDRFRSSTRPRPMPGCGRGISCIGLVISVSETKGNHTNLAKPDLLYKLSSKHAKVSDFPDI